MKKCTIKLVDNKWKAFDENGITFCAFEPDHKEYAVAVAEANGYTIIEG